MVATPKSPNPGDSNSVLMWKYAMNLAVIATAYGADLSTPKLGSSDNALLKSALDSILSFS